MKKLLTLIALCAVTTLGYGQSFEWNSKSASPAVLQKSADLTAYEKAYNERQIGMAGVYNPGLDGSRTIFGETYNSRELTASHSILPLGTLIRVINLDNNRNVTVRVNDRGQECADCLLTLSQAAATQLGISYRGRVSVERIGFSNWNPAPATAAPRTAAVAAYGSPRPATYQGTPAASGGVVRPVSVQGQTYGWQAKGEATPAAYGTTTAPQTYTRPYGGEYAALGAPATGSVMTREVDPAVRANQPATYSRYPTTVRPQTAPNVAPPVYQPVAQPQAYGATTAVQPYRQPAPTQAAPPAPTVIRYQEQRTVAAPATYQARPAPTTAAPATYQQTARSVTPYVAANTAPASAPTTGYVVQLGAYNNELYASNRVNQLRAAGLTNVFYRSVNKADGQVINRVYAGAFPSMAAAQIEANNIRKAHAIAGIVTSL